MDVADVSRLYVSCIFFFQAEDGIRDLVRSRGLGDVYKRQPLMDEERRAAVPGLAASILFVSPELGPGGDRACSCLLYTSDAADERSSVDLGGRRIIKKKKMNVSSSRPDS